MSCLHSRVESVYSNGSQCNQSRILSQRQRGWVVNGRSTGLGQRSLTISNLSRQNLFHIEKFTFSIIVDLRRTIPYYIEG